MIRKVRGSINVFLVSTLIALSVRLFLVEDYRIASNSMAPSLLIGDLIFVSKYNYNLHLPFSSYELVSFRRPVRSEIVTFTLPERGSQTFVKRVVALDGDTVAIKKGVLYVNGVPPEYKYRIQVEAGGGKDYGPVNIPPNHFFVLGDNRSDSNDSRAWGPVPYSCLKGRVGLVWLSLNPEGGIRRDRVGFSPN
jgi:signal peptidase I